jgi:hypothetical protein
MVKIRPAMEDDDWLSLADFARIQLGVSEGEVAFMWSWRIELGSNLHESDSSRLW